MRYFLSRYNRFYAFVIHRRPVELYVSTAIVMGIIAAAWYVVCYRTATRSIVVAQRTIASCTGGAAALHKRQQQCKSAQDAIQDLKKALYARRGQGDVLQLSSDAAKAAGIVLHPFHCYVRNLICKERRRTKFAYRWLCRVRKKLMKKKPFNFRKKLKG